MHREQLRRIILRYCELIARRLNTVVALDLRSHVDRQTPIAACGQTYKSSNHTMSAAERRELLEKYPLAA